MDIWAFGCIMLELFTGKKVWENVNDTGKYF